MSDQFTFEETNPWNWNQSVDLKSFKNPNFTSSEVSKSFEAFLNNPIEDSEAWNLEDFNKKANKKLKNKINVKNFRERKKNQQQKLAQKLKRLEHENNVLKFEKYCKHCKRPYGGLIQITKNEQQNLKKTAFEYDQQKQYHHVDEKQSIEFQKPTFYSKNEREASNKNGKIWVALGILMMIIGLHLYGFRGKEGYQDISISNIESKKIIDTFEGKNVDVGDYFDVKLKYKSKANTKSQENEHDIFKEIRIYHQGEKENVNLGSLTLKSQTASRFQTIEEETEKLFGDHHNFEYYKEQQVKFHRDFLFGIQAEIEEVGQYL